MTFLGQVNQNGDYQGYGKYLWEDGSSYIGFWENGEFHGKGTYIWPDGDKYVGDWIIGKRTGKGVFIWANKDIYQGEFLNGKRHGEGTQWHVDGNKYLGQWQDGERNGKGLFYIAASRAVYDVTWVNGQAIGYGRFMTAEKDIYEGYFLNGKRHGEGTFTWSDGSRIAAYWQNGIRDDKRVKDLPPKRSEWKPPDNFLTCEPLPISAFEPKAPPNWDSRPAVSASQSQNQDQEGDTVPEWQRKLLEKKKNQASQESLGNTPNEKHSQNASSPDWKQEWQKQRENPKKKRGTRTRRTKDCPKMETTT